MRIGVIDIGSNSIKLLIAERGSTLAVVYQTTWETRISEGISEDEAMLSEPAMAAGLEAVEKLIAEAKDFQPEEFSIVATSAVRDAQNRDAFIHKIKEATGHDLHVLTGVEEAAYIARGICTDPALAGHDEMLLCDLGGGSLECVHLKNTEVQQKVSLPLGAVRLMEQWIKDPASPLSQNDIRMVRSAVRSALAESSFLFPEAKVMLVGTGGALNVVRAIRARWIGQSYETVSSFISREYLRYLSQEITQMTLAQRVKIPELPENRADILPVALIVLDTLAECAQAKGFVHSLHNLRFGIAEKISSSLE